MEGTEWEGGETDEGEEEMERCGEEVKMRKNRDDQAWFRCRAAAFRPLICLIQVVFSWECRRNYI